MLPMVTGIWFHHHWTVETGAFRSMPAGATNMLTIECSKPRAKKIMIGSHIAAILPIVERATKAGATARTCAGAGTARGVFRASMVVAGSLPLGPFGRAGWKPDASVGR